MLPFEGEALENASTLILTFITMTVVYFVFLLFILSNVVLYYSCLEAKEAIQLLQKIEQIGNTKRIRGIEQEAL
ncbi:MAG: hypothetical protein HC892_00530 [Saprospiraceae bacterium]|nr:hypothetical protein [Saprospiraceae bacterium]